MYVKHVLLVSVVTQTYDSYVNQAHVIRGNDALVKCDIPSFAADFVSVLNWIDDQGSTLSAGGKCLDVTTKMFLIVMTPPPKGCNFHVNKFIHFSSAHLLA